MARLNCRSTLLLYLSFSLLVSITLTSTNPEGNWIAEELTKFIDHHTPEHFLENTFYSINDHHYSQFPGLICAGHAVYGAQRASARDLIRITYNPLPSHHAATIQMNIWFLDTWNDEYIYVDYYDPNLSNWPRVFRKKTEYQRDHDANICGMGADDLMVPLNFSIPSHTSQELKLHVLVWGDQDVWNESGGFSDIKVWLALCYPGCDDNGCTNSGMKHCKGDCKQGYAKIGDSCVVDGFTLHSFAVDPVEYLNGQWALGDKVYQEQDTFPGGDCFGSKTFGLGNTAGLKAGIIVNIPLPQAHAKVSIEVDAIMVDWPTGVDEVNISIDGNLVMTLQGNPKAETLTNGCGASGTDKVNHLVLGPINHDATSIEIKIESSKQIGVSHFKLYSFDCSDTCGSCSGDHSSLCLTCVQDHLLHLQNEDQTEGECHPKDDHHPDGCSPGYFLNQGVCLECHSSCLTCDSAEEGHCLSCYGQEILHVGAVETSHGLCLEAHSTNDGGCQDKYHVEDGRCVRDCSTNNFQQRVAIYEWLNTSNPIEQTGTLQGDHLVLSVIFQEPSKCIAELVAIKAFNAEKKIALGEQTTKSEGKWTIATTLSSAEMKNEDICSRQNTSDGAQYQCRIAFVALVDDDSQSSRTWYLPATVGLQDEVPLSVVVQELETELDIIKIELQLVKALVDENGDVLLSVPEVFTLGAKLHLSLAPPGGFQNQVTATLIKLVQRDMEIGSETYLEEIAATEGIPLRGPQADGSYIISIPLVKKSNNLLVEIRLEWAFDNVTGRLLADDEDDEFQPLVAQYSTSIAVEAPVVVNLEEDDESDSTEDTTILYLIILVLAVIVVFGPAGYCLYKRVKKPKYSSPKETPGTPTVEKDEKCQDRV